MKSLKDYARPKTSPPMSSESHPVPDSSPNAPAERQQAWADEVGRQVVEEMRKKPADYIPRY